MGLKLVGQVIYTFGTEAQKSHYLPRLRSGVDFWAQGFSEPGSGSDLASLRTSAVRKGDHYVVNGVKIWTTQAQYANRLFCLVRTDARCKPQQGISFLLIDMNQQGVRVRPIKSASGDYEVNEVFLDDVIVPVEDRVGEEGQGWSIAKFLLENERGGTCFAPALLAEVTRLRALANADAALSAALRARLESVALAGEALEITELRGLSEKQHGGSAGPQSLVTKLIASELRQDIEEIAMELAGADGLQLPFERPFDIAGDMPQALGSREAQVACARYLNSRAWTIFGGTSEIQLSIIAARALGL